MASDLLLEYIPEEILFATFPRKIAVSFISDYLLLLIVTCCKNLEPEGYNQISDFFITHHGLEIAVWLSWASLFCKIIKTILRRSQMTKFGCFATPIVCLNLIICDLVLYTMEFVEWFSQFIDEEYIFIQIVYWSAALIFLVLAIPMMLVGIPLLLFKSQRFRRLVKLSFHWWASISVVQFVWHRYYLVFGKEEIKYFFNNPLGILALCFLCTLKHLLDEE